MQWPSQVVEKISPLMPDLISDPVPFHTLDQQQQKRSVAKKIFSCPNIKGSNVHLQDPPHVQLFKRVNIFHQPSVVIHEAINDMVMV